MDQLYQQAAVELDAAKRTALFIQMNDLAVAEVVEISLVYRASAVAKTKTFNWSKNAPWDSNLWNTADWTRA
jgi:peptide/nickel transport system substrate-binding protein